jgi:membrane protease YdiL (CAAX protease family)
MSIEPQLNPDAPLPVPAAPVSAPAEVKPAPIAPWWHTLILVALILANSLLGSSKVQSVGSAGHGSRLLLYASTFITQSVLIIIVWFGIRSRKVSMRDLIGGRWSRVEDFLIDLGLAALFLFTSLILLFALRVALGLIDLHNMQKSQDEAMRALGSIAPHTYLEAGFFVLLSIIAGLFEEIIFRGYLQKQFHAFARSAVLGIVLSGIVFGLAHGYQGWRNMIVIAVFGMFFGILAYFRKSLRPGMIAHACQDSFAGIALFFLVRNHK